MRDYLEADGILILLLANSIITPKDNHALGTMQGVVVRVIIAVLAVLEQ